MNIALTGAAAAATESGVPAGSKRFAQRRLGLGEPAGVGQPLPEVHQHPGSFRVIPLMARAANGQRFLRQLDRLAVATHGLEQRGKVDHGDRDLGVVWPQHPSLDVQHLAVHGLGRRQFAARPEQDGQVVHADGDLVVVVGRHRALHGQRFTEQLLGARQVAAVVHHQRQVVEVARHLRVRRSTQQPAPRDERAPQHPLRFFQRAQAAVDLSHGLHQPGLDLRLVAQIALHAGPVRLTTDPITGLAKVCGTHVSRAARLEPKTPPGQVYASEAFAALTAKEDITEFRCDYVKQLEWAKRYGTFPAYVLRRRDPAPSSAGGR